MTLTRLKKLILLTTFFLPGFFAKAQDTTSIKDSLLVKDTIIHPHGQDTALRIRNLNPYFTLHVDSVLNYQLEINKESSRYYWFLKNSPVGMKIDKDNGTLYFKAAKNYFLSGRLKYDQEYKVQLGVQNLNDPAERVDTAFTILFFNTEIIPSKIKLSVNPIVVIDEGDTLSFKVQCEEGSFPIENITFNSNIPIKPIVSVAKCGDEFIWSPNYEFIKDGDTAVTKILQLSFIGANKFSSRDTTLVRVVVKNNINFPARVEEHNAVRKDISNYLIQLKGTFMVLDKSIKGTKSTRTTFEMSSAGMALGGTVFSSLPSEAAKTTGKILPSAAVGLVPVKESVAPIKVYEVNSASLIRANIKRLEFLLQDNQLTGPRDPDILAKTKKLKDELKQVQMQLIDIPIVEFESSPEELDKYFNSPKVSNKYRVKKVE
jgi:hypothetical protein